MLSNNLLNNDILISRIYKGFISISVLLYTISILEINKSNFVYGGLGLISILPSTFFISLFFLSISFIILLYFQNSKNGFMLQCFLVLLFILHVTPILVEGTPRFRSCFSIGGEIDALIINNHLDPTLYRYNNWPAADIIGAIIIYVTGIDVLSLLLYSPVFSQTISLFLVIPILKLVCVESQKIWLACWIFIVTNWLNQDYFSPQNVAFIIYLSSLLVIIILIFKSENKQISSKVTLIILCISLLVAHILTPFILILNIIALIGVSFYYNKTIRFRFFIALISIMFISWQIYVANSMFSTLVHALVDSVGLDSISSTAQDRILTGSYDHKVITHFRLYFSIFILSLTFFGFLVAIYKNGLTYPLIVVTAFLFSGPMLIVVGGYGGEIFIRIMLFSLFPIAYFISQGMDHKALKIFILLFLLLSPTLFIIGKYGSESIDYTPYKDIKGSDFFFEHASLGSKSIVMYDNLYKRKMTANFSYQDKFSNIANEINGINKVQYIWVTESSNNICNYLHSELEYIEYQLFKDSLENKGIFNKIYTNPTYNLYYIN